MGTIPTFSTTVTALADKGSPYGVDIAQRVASDFAVFQQIIDTVMFKLRVALPCKIVAFDAVRQVVSVQPVIVENVRNNGIPQTMQLPLLNDIPVVLPRGGGFSLTFPILPGDECLVVFSDMCMDTWWQNGGSNNQQAEVRRHDLSDGFAIMGCWSQKRVLPEYSTSAVELRSDDGSIYVKVSEVGVVITAPIVEVNTTGNIDLNATGNVELNATNVSIVGIDWLTHKHVGVTVGSGDTGGVVI